MMKKRKHLNLKKENMIHFLI